VKYREVFSHLYQLNAVYVSVLFLRFFSLTDISLQLIENKDFAALNLIVFTWYRKWPFLNRNFSLQSLLLILFFYYSSIKTLPLYWLLSTHNDIVLPTYSLLKSIKQRYSSFLQFPHDFNTKCGLFQGKVTGKTKRTDETKFDLFLLNHESDISAALWLFISVYNFPEHDIYRFQD
jgi:hypothetical protein